LPHAEAVLLIDHHQSELFELDITLQQLVRTDDDVHLAGLQGADDAVAFLLAAKARQLFDIHTPFSEAILEVLMVLLSEQGRGYEDGDLIAGIDGDKGSAHRDFGLAEAHVAADQPVHGPCRVHIVDDGLDGEFLIRRLFKGKAALEACQRLRIDCEFDAGARCPASVDVEQFRGHVMSTRGRLAARSLPLSAAEPMQRRVFRIGAGEAADEVQ